MSSVICVAAEEKRAQQTHSAGHHCIHCSRIVVPSFSAKPKLTSIPTPPAYEIHERRCEPSSTMIFIYLQKYFGKRKFRDHRPPGGRARYDGHLLQV